MKQKRLSRSKVDLFIQRPKCFWLNINKKISRPSGPPFSLNVAVDYLFKNEFDRYRGKSTPPRLSSEGLNFIPAENPNLAEWRENFKGVTRVYGSANIEFFGAIDDTANAKTKALTLLISIGKLIYVPTDPDLLIL
jgi:hypothetical protein